MERRTRLKRSAPKRRQRFAPSTWREIMHQSDGSCVRCGRRGHLDPHHVLPVRRWPLLELVVANVVLLCRRCHDRHEYPGVGSDDRLPWDRLPGEARLHALGMAGRDGEAEAYLIRTYPGFPLGPRPADPGKQEVN